MGQNITAIVTKQTDIELPEDLPHITKNGQTVIAYNDNFGGFLNNIIKEVLKTGNTDFLSYCKKYDIAMFIKNLSLTSFAVIHSSDWGGMPVDDYEFTVINNRIIPDSFLNSDSNIEFDWEKYEENNAKKLLGIDWDAVMEYHNYREFEYLYRYAKSQTYFMVKVLSDGPIPGDNSMISFAAVAIKENLSDTFYAELKPISEHSEQHWPDEHKYSRKKRMNAEDPEKVMADFSKWVRENSNGRPILISNTIGYDVMFLAWYFKHFKIQNSFAPNFNYVYNQEDLNSLYKGLSNNIYAKLEDFEKLEYKENPLENALQYSELFLKIAKHFDFKQ